MPLYEYECQSCHRRLEKIHQKFSDPPLEVCPHCGGRLQKLVSSPAFQFKGSGWYATDYARKSEKPASDSTSKDAKDTKDAADKSDKTPSEKSEKSEKAEKKDSSDTKPAADPSSGKAPTKDAPKSTS